MTISAACVLHAGFMRRLAALEDQVGESAGGPAGRNQFGPIQQNAMAATILDDMLAKVDVRA